MRTAWASAVTAAAPSRVVSSVARAVTGNPCVVSNDGRSFRAACPRGRLRCRCLVPSRPVLASLRRLDGVRTVARKLATAQTFAVTALVVGLASRAEQPDG